MRSSLADYVITVLSILGIESNTIIISSSKCIKTITFFIYLHIDNHINVSIFVNRRRKESCLLFVAILPKIRQFKLTFTWTFFNKRTKRRTFLLNIYLYIIKNNVKYIKGQPSYPIAYCVLTCIYCKPAY